MTERVVIVGASLGGVRTAEALRASGFAGEIVIVGTESHQPYDRPDLSKRFLCEPDATHTDLALMSRQAAASLGIQLRLGVSAQQLDCARRTVVLDDGIGLMYDHCVVATGAQPRKGPWLATANTFTLRTIDDARALRSRLQPKTRVAVVGAGFVGGEVASSASSLGCAVTVIDPSTVPMNRTLGESVGALFADLFAQNDVVLRLGVAVDSIQELHGASRLVLSDGRHIDADVIVVGIGATPADGWLASTDLQVADGLICDRYCRAVGTEDVYAVGDVARWHHVGYGELVRAEHWTNAVQQAQAVAHNLVHPEQLTEYRPVDYVWSDQHGMKLQFAGRFSSVETFEVIGEADFTSPQPRAAIVCSDAEANFVACAAINWPAACAHARRLLAQGSRFSSALDSLKTLRLKATVSQHER